MDKTTVVNLKAAVGFDVYIGRPSDFGNPFRIGKDGDRTKVVDLFSKYFYNRLKTDPKFKLRVLSLKGKRLGCYCKPEQCHGDIIAEYVNTYKEGT